MKGIVAILGLAIMFAAIPPRAKPQPAAPAGAVLFTEGKAIEPTSAPETDLDIVPVTPAPVLVDIGQLERLAENLAEYAAKVVTPPPAEFTKTGQDSGNPVDRIVQQADSLDPSWRKSVYRVRVTGTSTDPRSRGLTAMGGGTAVAVGPGKLHTAAHLTHQLAGYVAEVEVDGKWIRGSWAVVPGKDLAVLTVTGVELTPAPVRTPVYGEPVTVYGLSSQSYLQGKYAGDVNPAAGGGIVPLEPGEPATQQGDSGGGVFGDDGALLGTLTGNHTYVEQVATMVPIVADAPRAIETPKAQAQAPQNCPGGVCPAPSVQQQPTQWFTPRRSRKH